MLSGASDLGEGRVSQNQPIPHCSSRVWPDLAFWEGGKDGHLCGEEDGYLAGERKMGIWGRGRWAFAGRGGWALGERRE